MRRVVTANPYKIGILENDFSARNILMRQHKFPDFYENDEQMTCIDDDRVKDNMDLDKYIECTHKHTGHGPLMIGYWARNAPAEKIMSFLKEFLELDHKINWTGFRITGTVHRGNGYVVWHLAVFAKNPESQTKVYSSSSAPNVNQPKRSKFRRSEFFFRQ